jgi:cytochrome c oxidase cbb3-type subunit IV
MNAYNVMSIVTTVLAIVAFLGIVAWAYGRGRRKAFDEAANAPFALPDENDEPSTGNDRRAEPRP